MEKLKPGDRVTVTYPHETYWNWSADNFIAVGSPIIVLPAVDKDRQYGQGEMINIKGQKAIIIAVRLSSDYLVELNCGSQFVIGGVHLRPPSPLEQLAEQA